MGSAGLAYLAFITAAAVAAGLAWMVKGLRSTLETVTRENARLTGQALLVDLSHDAIITMDERRRITGWNRGAEELYGYTETEANGQIIHELLKTRSATVTPAGMDTVLQRQGRWEGELDHTAMDGRRLQVESRQILVRDGAGRPKAILEINRDITGRKRAEESSAQAHAQMESILDSIPEPIMVTDVDGRLIRVNEAFRASIAQESTVDGYVPRVETYAEDGRLIPPEDWPINRVRRGERLTGCDIELRIDGVSTDRRFSGKPVRDAQGNVTHAVLAFFDISDQKRQARALRAANEELRKAEARLRLVHDVARMGTFEWSLEDGWVKWSPEMEAIYGISSETHLHTVDEWTSTVYPADLAPTLAAMNAAVSERRATLDITYRVVRAGGEVIWVHSRGKYEYGDGGEPRAMLGMNMDITSLKLAEQALAQANVRMEAILETAPAGVLLADASGKLLLASRACETILGRPVGSDGAEAVAELMPQLEMALAGRSVSNVAIEVKRPDGLEATLLCAAKPLHGGDGALWGAVAVFQDITERKRAEESVRASERKYRAIFEAAAVGIGRVGFGDARWIDVNDAFCRMVGYSREELLVTPWPEITHPEDVEIDLVPFRRMAAGAFQAYTVEKRFLHKSGAPVWARLTLSVVRDGAGRPDYEIAIIEDVNDRKQAEEALHDALRRYEQQTRLFEGIASTTPDFVYIFDREGRFLYANRRLLDVWGMELNEAVGKTCLELGYEQWHHDMHMREIAEVIETRRGIKGEVPFRAPRTGIFGIYEYIFTPVIGPDGEVEIVAGTTRDITERKASEQALRNSEQRFRALVTATADVVYSMSPDWTEMRSLRGQEFLPDTEHPTEFWIDRYIPRGDQHAVRSAIAEAIRTRATFEMEHRVVRIDGSLGWAFSRAIPLLGQQGEILEWFGTASDITWRKQAEEALVESERRYKGLFESMQEAFAVGEIIFDPEGHPVDWCYIDVNPAFERTFGVERNDIIGRTYREAFPQGPWQYWAPALAEVAVSGKPAHLDHVSADGSRHFEAIAYQPEARRFAAIFSDVTERMRAMSELRRMDQMVRLAQSAGKSGVWEWDLDADVITWSDEHYTLFGVDSSFRPSSGAWLPLIHAEDRSYVRDRLQEVVRECSPEFAIEFRRVAPGEVRWLEMRGQAMCQGGRATKVVGLTTDVTERKRLEQALVDSNEDLKRFAYVASHDLQEPLRNVTTFCQLLERQNRGKVDAESEKFLTVIVGAAKRMSALITDLLLYSRVTNDASDAELVDLNHALATALDNLKMQIAESRAEIVKTPLPALIGIESLLARVFQNLVGNAIKYRRADRVPLIEIGATQRDTHWLFSVKDNGIGFDMEHADDIFVIFKRLHGAGKYSGSGIGLAVVKRIVERHGGRVWVESAPGLGSTFYFTLPTASAPAMEPLHRVTFHSDGGASR